MHTSHLQLSVVVVAWNGPEALCLCMDSLVDRLDPVNCELVVAADFQVDHIAGLSRPVPRFRTVCLPPKTSVPELRRHGLDRTEGSIVAFIEDHCRCDGRWATEIVKAHRSGHAIVGGAVENASGLDRLSWAVYFYDYGAYMLPGIPHAALALSGINVSYTREVLGLVRDQYEEGFYETFVNAALQERGYALYFIPTAVVYHDKSYELKAALRDCYGYGRDFAARRLADASRVRQLLYAGMSVLLPALQVSRIVSRTVRRRRHLGKLVGSLPHVVLLMIAWSYGELRGYLGRSIPAR